MKPRLFQRGDWICAALAALIAFAGYAWTTAPSVTLLDSGEFIVAAQHFGVPHPTGYPLWTLLAWLFQLVPLGNVAWQLALFSGLCGALAVGLATLLIRNSARWMMPGLDARSAGICALSLGLTFAFSFSMWSQAVIVEVYTLHALLIGLYLACLYAWVRRPERLAGLYGSFFVLALAFSNHQLAIVYAILPLQFVVVGLLRRDLFWDLLLALMVCALLAYLAFAQLSNDPVVLKAALRLGYLVLTILAIALLLKRGRLNWRLSACLPFVLAAGLLPYLYMPVASATNPPMNWGYTSTPEGFFYSFNRSQYPGTLSELSVRIFSKVLGVASGAAAAKPSGSVAGELMTWSGFFAQQLLRSFSPLAPLFFLAAMLGVLRQPRPAQAWIALLVVAFLLAMALQPALEQAGTDQGSWWLQMPYHTYTNFLFAVLCGLGACFLGRRLPPRGRPALWLLLLLPLWPIWLNAGGASQRGHWLGWKYGHDMLSPLPRGSVIFGGTDPGRFIPTYLIFGESSLPPARRIDPAFDRRDLYVLTQNGLSDRYYLNYIRDQYAAVRPRARTAFERWLGRETAYPSEPLVLPTLVEMQEIRQAAAAEAREKRPAASAKEVGEEAIAAIAKWIFDRNKARHAFYVEESFVMRWSYDQAIPDGLLYRLNPEPLAQLPDAAVRRDFAFWDGYLPRLKADPTFARDFDAQRSFARLRLTGARIYEHRALGPAAEKAYRQTLELWPGNLDAIAGLARLLWARGEFDEIIAFYQRALQDDPNSRATRDNLAQARLRKETQREIDALLVSWRQAPRDIATLEKLVTHHFHVGEEQKADDVLREAIGRVGPDPAFFALVVRISEAQGRWQQAADAASRWAQAEPMSAEANYRLARAQFLLGSRRESAETLGTALRLGGVAMRERLFTDPAFQSLKDVPELKKLMVAPPPAP